LVNINGVIGSQFNDVLIGDEGNNAFRGNAGDDIIDGGDGNDTVLYNTALSSVYVDLDAGFASDGMDYFTNNSDHSDGLDELDNIENIIGSDLSSDNGGGDGDKLYGSTGVANKIWGLDGHDILDGRGGADTLFGGAGDDTY